MPVLVLGKTANATSSWLMVIGDQQMKNMSTTQMSILIIFKQMSLF